MFKALKYFFFKGKTHRRLWGQPRNKRSLYQPRVQPCQLLFWPQGYTSTPSSTNSTGDQSHLRMEGQTPCFLCLWLWKQNSSTKISSKVLLGLSNLVKYMEDQEWQHLGFELPTYALSFYRFQKILGWSKFFVPNLRLIYMLCKSQTFCARPIDEF